MSQLMLYPNSVSVPLMTNFGIPVEPEGMVHVTLQKIEGLKSTDFMTKGDPYVVFEVRIPGRNVTCGILCVTWHCDKACVNRQVPHLSMPGC